MTFSNARPPDIRTDLTFFVNGIPVIVVETKAATKLEGIAEAFDDIRYYHEKGPELLALAQLHALTHLVQFFYGATWDLSRAGLFNWRDDAGAHGPAPLQVDFETLVKTFVAPRRVLRMLSDFILFVRRDGELSKAVLRPHQMRAAERCVTRARDAKKRRGLVWHTQGSGKTYTMITVAKLLMADPSLANPTVLLLVDRNELEAQLADVLEAVGVHDPAVVKSKRHLRELLAADRRGLIVSMIHKFDDIPADLNTRANIFVLVDEAHRTTGGDLGNYLMGTLPNATYLGFTGTPIDRTAHGKGTFKVFGVDDERGYLDKYSIRESVADGTTVPLHYALAPNELHGGPRDAGPGVPGPRRAGRRSPTSRRSTRSSRRQSRSATCSRTPSAWRRWPGMSPTTSAQPSSRWATRPSSWPWTARPARSTRRHSTAAFRRSGRRW